MEDKYFYNCKICDKGWISCDCIVDIHGNVIDIITDFKKRYEIKNYSFGIPCKCEKGENLLSKCKFLKNNLIIRNKAYEWAKGKYLERVQFTFYTPVEEQKQFKTELFNIINKTLKSSCSIKL